MSYLLDALNKSKGEGSSDPASYAAQPVMYAQPGFASDEGVNIYKWISIVLALILTLIVGVFLGNRYALFVVAPQPQVAVQQPATQPPPQTQLNANQVAPIKTEQSQTANVSDNTVASTQPTQTEPSPQIQDNQPEASKSAQPQTQGQSQVKFAKAPESTVSPSAQLDAQVSPDLLSRFNQAIKASEGVENNYDHTEQTDYAIEEYLTKAPSLNELDPAQQIKVPGFTYDAHMYSTDPAQRYVKLNGGTFIEKEWISEEIQIYEIQRQFLIFEMGHVRFSLPALTDWQEVKL